MTQKFLPEQYDPLKTSERKSYKQKVDNFIYNEETGEIMGRTLESWGMYYFQSLKIQMVNIK